MQIVIDITEGHYKTLQAMSDIGLGYYYDAILNGTPLPKGHGDLIDRKDFDMITKEEINAMKPVIEADKESEDEE